MRVYRSPDPVFLMRVSAVRIRKPRRLISELKNLSGRQSKIRKPDTYDAAFAKAARRATVELQQGKPGWAVWQHIINVSVADLKK